jgi:hypothetical protein
MSESLETTKLGGHKAVNWRIGKPDNANYKGNGQKYGFLSDSSLREISNRVAFYLIPCSLPIIVCF